MSKKRQTRKEKLSAQSKRTHLSSPVLTQNSESPTISLDESTLNTVSYKKKSSSPSSAAQLKNSQPVLVIRDLQKSIIASLVLIGLTFILSVILQNNRIIEMLNLP